MDNQCSNQKNEVYCILTAIIILHQADNYNLFHFQLKENEESGDKVIGVEFKSGEREPN